MAVQPDNIVGTPTVSTRPSGGLIGAASIINVAQGTLLATRAEALAGFTNVSLYTASAHWQPTLASVNDVSAGGTATAHVFDDQGRALSLSYGGPGVTSSRPVDAVSAVLMTDQVYNEYVISPALNAGSDWVLTFPTKQFYVDPLFAGSATIARPPFEEIFDSAISAVRLTQAFYDRNGVFANYDYSNCGSVCPLSPEPPVLRYAINVLAFSNAMGLIRSQVLKSALFDYAQPRIVLPSYPSWSPYSFDAIRSDTGWMRLNWKGVGHHQLSASQDGKVLHGLPVIGFWATNLVNNNVSNGVLSNYATAVRHATSVTCVKTSDGSACD